MSTGPECGASPPSVEEWLARRIEVFDVYQAWLRGAERTDRMVGLSSARSRLLAYLRLNVGKPVCARELAGVAGISDWARRVRELDVEDGWPILVGPAADLPKGWYRLERDRPDLDRARAWRQRKEVRQLKGAGIDRVLALLVLRYPDPVSDEDLTYVARIRSWPRRIRNLQEAGWDVATSATDPSLPNGWARLDSNTVGPSRSRRAITQRAVILERDLHSCRDCGASPKDDHGVRLQIHHVHAVQDGGGNEEANLVTLCVPCHAGRHAISPRSTRVKDDLLYPADDLGWCGPG